nr:MAG TPA: hypothetical protein [Caudoviricetes sp.]
MLYFLSVITSILLLHLCLFVLASYYDLGIDPCHHNVDLFQCFAHLGFNLFYLLDNRGISLGNNLTYGTVSFGNKTHSYDRTTRAITRLSLIDNTGRCYYASLAGESVKQCVAIFIQQLYRLRPVQSCAIDFLKSESTLECYCVTTYDNFHVMYSFFFMYY